MNLRKDNCFYSLHADGIVSLDLDFKMQLGNGLFTYKKHRKPALHFLTADHVLEISVKLKFQCVRFEKKALFCSGGVELASYLFLFTRWNVYHMILLYFETKEMIYESMNLKGVVY